MTNAMVGFPTALHPLFVWYPEKSEFVAKAIEMQRDGTLKTSEPVDEQDFEILWAIESLYSKQKAVDE